MEGNPGVVVIPPAGKSASSGAGGSYWDPFSGCPRRSFLERMVGMQVRTHDPETGERKMKKISWNSTKTTPVIDQAIIGIMFGAIREHYRMHVGCECIFEYQDGNENLEWGKATALWEGYKQNAAPQGKCLSMEEPFEFGCRACMDGTCDKPRVFDSIPFCEEGTRAWKLVGLPYHTGRMDETAEVDCQEFLDYWIARGAPADLAIGDLVFVDTKTKTQHNSYLVQEYTTSKQFQSYQMIARAMGRNVRGMLADVAICTKEPDFVKFWVPFPTVKHQQVVREHNMFSYAMRGMFGEDFANPSRCKDWNKLCSFFEKQCDRTNDFVPETMLTLAHKAR